MLLFKSAPRRNRCAPISPIITVNEEDFKGRGGLARKHLVIPPKNLLVFTKKVPLNKGILGHSGERTEREFKTGGGLYELCELNISTGAHANYF
jgi:hypothetical protein